MKSEKKIFLKQIISSSMESIMPYIKSFKIINQDVCE